MSSWLILAKGPAFFFVLAIFVLGLLRLIIVTLWDIADALQRAGHRRLPYGQIARQTITWFIPIGRLHRARWGYSLASFGLHMSILIAGLFLRNHLDIWQSNLGCAWFSIPKRILDALTLLGIVGASILLLSRIYVASSRYLSRPTDYLLLVLILNIFISGFVAGRAWNPVPYDATMFFHTLNGMTLLVLAPFTKVAHCVLFPLIRFASEIAWHFTPRGGEKVVQALHGPEGRKI